MIHLLKFDLRLLFCSTASFECSLIVSRLKLSLSSYHEKIAVVIERGFTSEFTFPETFAVKYFILIHFLHVLLVVDQVEIFGELVHLVS